MGRSKQKAVLERSPKKAQCIWFAMVKELVEVVDDEVAGKRRKGVEVSKKVET